MYVFGCPSTLFRMNAVRKPSRQPLLAVLLSTESQAQGPIISNHTSLKSGPRSRSCSSLCQLPKGQSPASRSLCGNSSIVPSQSTREQLRLASSNASSRVFASCDFFNICRCRSESLIAPTFCVCWRVIVCLVTAKPLIQI